MVWTQSEEHFIAKSDPLSAAIELDFCNHKVLNYNKNLIDLRNESFSCPLHKRLAHLTVHSGLVRTRADKLAKLTHDLQNR